VERVDRGGGVGGRSRKPGAGEITDDEPGPAGQPEQCGPVRGLLDRDRREVHSYQRGIRLPGQPQARAAAPAAQIGECLARPEVRGLQDMAQQAS